MLADQDNPLEADPTADSAGASEPRLVVVYRSRGVPWLLVPPLLLLSAVAAIIGFRKLERPEFPMVMPAGPTAVALASQTSPNTAPTAVEASKSIAPVVEPPPKRDSTMPMPDLSGRPAVPGEVAPVTVVAAANSAVPEIVGSPPSLVAAAPVVTPKPEPIELEPTPPPVDPVKRAPVGFDPDAAKVVAAELAAPPKPKETEKGKDAEGPPPAPARRDTTPPFGNQVVRPMTDEALEEEQRAAEQRQAERAGLKPPSPDLLLNPDPQEVLNRRHELYNAARRQAAEDRAPFHADLRQLIAESGNRAGAEIKLLCNRYGRDTMPEIHGAMNNDLLHVASRLSTPARIQRMRQWGVPETIILDDLVDTEVRLNVSAGGAMHVARGAPRTADEAWVRASRILLASPPTKPGTKSNTAAARATAGAPRPN